MSHRSLGMIVGTTLTAALLGSVWAGGPLDDLRSLFRPRPRVEPATELFTPVPTTTVAEGSSSTGTALPGVVNCANLIYGNHQTSVCFSAEFLSTVQTETHIQTNPQLVPVSLESADLFQFPFAVMTGEGAFTLTEQQRRNMRDYLQAGGFIIASAGCSSDAWRQSFLREIALVFPELSLSTLDFRHPVFHTVYDINELKCKGSHRAHLEGLEIDGKIVLIFSPDGLNDTSKAGGNCCCCGGNEIKNARQMNVNLLAYTLTH